MECGTCDWAVECFWITLSSHPHPVSCDCLVLSSYQVLYTDCIYVLYGGMQFKVMLGKCGLQSTELLQFIEQSSFGFSVNVLKGDVKSLSSQVSYPFIPSELV